ncbi:hypothetical protein KCMC57_63830 (plasmid) [Kitasatospora sp. CMC57]|uniref:Minor tail protein n=1 Tax=Kitasatospora sp. CMC57 TaxID=3231513 RepID=A0AB33K735_9ACTN
MTVRLWITNAAPPYTPATRHGSWTTASGEDIQLLGRKPQGSAGTSSISLAAGSGTRKVLLHRSISAGAVKAGTISGTIQWMIGVKESNALLDAVWHIHAWVTAGDSDTERGVLLSNYTGSTEFTTTATGTTAGQVAVSSVAIQTGDRLVIEIGYETSTTTAASYSATINYGSTGTTDLAATDTAVTTEPGWVEITGADGLFTAGFSTLTDAFTSSIDSKWTKTTNVTSTGGRARIPCTTTLEDLYTATAYEIQGSQVAFQVPTLPATGGGSSIAFSAYLSAGPTISTTNLEFEYNPATGNLVLRNSVGGSDASPTTLTYSAVDHLWWRFREAAGSIYMETAPDGSTWTIRRTITPSQWMRTGTLIFYCEAQRASGTADFAEIDSVNVSSGTTVAVTNAAEVDTAQTIGRTKSRTVGNAAEVDTAQTIGRTKSRTVGNAAEVDTAQTIGRTKSRTVGNAAEVDTAQTIGRTKARATATAAAVETAQPIGRSKRLAVIPVIVVETAQGLAAAKRLAVAPATEVATAAPVGRTKSRTVPTVTATETAQPLGRAKVRPLTPALAVEAAQQLARSKSRPVATAYEIAAAQPPGRSKRLTLIAAVEITTAMAITTAGFTGHDLTVTVRPIPGAWTVTPATGRWTARPLPARWQPRSD